MNPKTCLVVSVSLLAALCGCQTDGALREDSSQAGHGGGHKRPCPKDLSAYIAKLESPGRAHWQKRDDVLAALALRPGERVADIGAGSGYFTIPLAQAVAPEGVVWAVDIEQKMLDHTAERAQSEKLNNIRLILAPEDDPQLPAGQIDTILIVNTYHHFTDRPAYVKKMRQALAPGGRIVNIDFIPKPKEERGFGPPLWMQLPRETVDREMAQSGLVPARSHDFLPEQYFVEYVLKK